MLFRLNKIRDVTLADCASIFPMLAALLLKPFMSSRYRDTWVICERRDEARDNGLWFFKHLCENHPQQKCVYFIDQQSPDYDLVNTIGPTERFGGIKHWLAYFTAPYLISSQSCKPNGFLCTLLERSGLFTPNHVFLQHGITINRAPYLFANRRKVKYFITGTIQEAKFVEDALGHKGGVVQLTGFARFDGLHGNKPSEGTVLVMPTWRKWLRKKSERRSGADNDIMHSEYVQQWKRFLNSKKLVELLEVYDLNILFFPHSNMLSVLDVQTLLPETARVQLATEENIQACLQNAALLVTDYSSVFFDMAYMKKPTLFFQFDELEFRRCHYPEGWFDYGDTAFGEVCHTLDELISALGAAASAGFEISSSFEEEHVQTFPWWDEQNSERIYRLLSGESSYSVSPAAPNRKE